jgi:hypothetical protein
MYKLSAQEALLLACKAATIDTLSQETADKISRANNGITFVLEFLNHWEKQKTLDLFDWEYLAIESKDFLLWVKENQKWRWDRIPNEQIEKYWNEFDQKI